MNEDLYNELNKFLIDAIDLNKFNTKNLDLETKEKFNKIIDKYFINNS